MDKFIRKRPRIDVYEPNCSNSEFLVNDVPYSQCAAKEETSAGEADPEVHVANDLTFASIVSHSQSEVSEVQQKQPNEVQGDVVENETEQVIHPDRPDVVNDISRSKFSSPCQPNQLCFPKTAYGRQQRSFQSSWYRKYPWMEYSKKQDAVYCFCCRWFRSGNQSQGGANSVFVQLGYNNWQKATQPGRGFDGHDHSMFHQACYHAWKMWQEAQHNSTSIAHKLSQTQLILNRVYLTYVANLIRFLVINEKPMRGSDEYIGNINCGFFLAMMERDLSNQKELRQAADSIPRNCCYTSPEAQNEIIAIWFGLLQQEIIRRVSESSMYCVIADETRNKNNVEDMCICIRHVDSMFVAHEYLLDITALEELNAASICATLLSVLTETVGTDRLVAQSYDGASVMSGCTGGVQALVSAAVGRTIIYIHCFAHKLHLVVLKVLHSSNHVTWVLEICHPPPVIRSEPPRSSGLGLKSELNGSAPPPSGQHPYLEIPGYGPVCIEYIY